MSEFLDFRQEKQLGDAGGRAARCSPERRMLIFCLARCVAKPEGKKIPNQIFHPAPRERDKANVALKEKRKRRSPFPRPPPEHVADGRALRLPEPRPSDWSDKLGPSSLKFPLSVKEV